MFQVRFYREGQFEPVKVIKNCVQLVTGPDLYAIGVRSKPNPADHGNILTNTYEYGEDFDFFSIWET